MTDDALPAGRRGWVEDRRMRLFEVSFELRHPAAVTVRASSTEAAVMRARSLVECGPFERLVAMGIREVDGRA